MWKKLKAMFFKLFGCKSQPTIVEPPVTEKETPVKEIPTLEPVIKQLKKKRQTKS